MTDPTGIRLRPATSADEPFMLRLYASSREPELAAVAWTDEQKDAFVRQQFAAQDASYRQAHPDGRFDVVERDGVPIGRLSVADVPGERMIIDVALLPDERGRGIGTHLLTQVIAEAEREDRAVCLHVEQSNPARRLYERLGFAVVSADAVYLRMERPAPASIS